MLDDVVIRNNPNSALRLDEAFHQAIVLAWGELFGPESRSIRVEYLREEGIPMDHLSIWSLRGGGYEDRVCDYWASASSTHASGTTFYGTLPSDELARNFDFIMKNQGLFTSRADSALRGMVLIPQPAGNERAAAAEWMHMIRVEKLLRAAAQVAPTEEPL